MKWIAGLVALLLVVVAGVVQLSRPLPQVTAHLTQANGTLSGTAPSISWPSGTESALAVSGVGIVGVHGPTTPVPIGSVTKMMTAYLMLLKHPLGAYSSGPSIKVTAADVSLYNKDVSSQQSAAPVVAGESLSERQLLEGLLVASGNNIATMSADWLAGNPTSFAHLMNQEATKLGMTHTHYVGPSGLNPEDVSIPSDQIRLAEAAMKLPAFRAIVDMPQINWPNDSQLIYNYNYLVGHYGIVGVKTGSTLQSGGCYIFAAPRPTGANGSSLVYGAVLGQQGTLTASQLQASLTDGVNLLNQTPHIVKSYPWIHKGQVVGSLSVPWSHAIPLIAQSPAVIPGWGHMSVTEVLHLNTNHPTKTTKGTITVTQGTRHWTVPVSLKSPVPAPTLSWRLVHG